MFWVLMLAMGACGVEGAVPAKSPAVESADAAVSVLAEQALGDLSDVDPSAVRLYVDPDGFSVMPPVRKGDWRSRFDEPPQTVDAYRASAANPVTLDRDTLYLLPLGEFPAELVVERELVVLVRSPPFSMLGDFLERFYAMPVVVGTPSDPERLGVPVRSRNNHEQLNARVLLSTVASALPKNGYGMMALLNRDLFVSDEQEYAFGYAMLQGRLGVMSFARYDPMFVGRPRSPDFEAVIAARSRKVLAHEVGHLFGLEHCAYYRCVMNGYAHPAELDRVPVFLCPVCLRKLELQIGFEPEARYERLRTFFADHGLAAEADWLAQRLARIRADRQAGLEPLPRRLRR